MRIHVCHPLAPLGVRLLFSLYPRAYALGSIELTAPPVGGAQNSARLRLAKDSNLLISFEFLEVTISQN